MTYIEYKRFHYELNQLLMINLIIRLVFIKTKDIFKILTYKG